MPAVANKMVKILAAFCKREYIGSLLLVAPLRGGLKFRAASRRGFDGTAGPRRIPGAALPDPAVARRGLGRPGPHLPGNPFGDGPPALERRSVQEAFLPEERRRPLRALPSSCRSSRSVSSLTLPSSISTWVFSASAPALPPVAGLSILARVSSTARLTRPSAALRAMCWR